MEKPEWMTLTLKEVGTIKTNALTKQTMRILTLKGFRVWRQNNMGVYDAKLKCYRANSGNRLGVSDIIGYHTRTGQFIACEVKAGKDRVSKWQTLFLEDVKNCGGVALVIRGTKDLENLINELNKSI